MVKRTGLSGPDKALGEGVLSTDSKILPSHPRGFKLGELMAYDLQNMLILKSSDNK